MKVIKYDGPTHPEGWCREGVAVESRPGVFIDTFWASLSNDSYHLTEEQVESAEVLFDTDDFDELTTRDHARWETYAESDRARIPYQAGHTISLWIRKGAQPDLATMIANKRRDVADAESALKSAGSRLRWLSEELGRLYEQQSSTAVRS